MFDSGFEESMHMRSEPPLWLERLEQIHERRRAKCAVGDLGRECWFVSKQGCEVAMLGYALGPVMREKDMRIRK